MCNQQELSHISTVPIHEMMLVEANGEPKMVQIWSRAVKGYRLKNVYEPKTFKFRTELMDSIMEHAKESVAGEALRVSACLLLASAVKAAVCMPIYFQGKKRKKVGMVGYVLRITCTLDVACLDEVCIGIACLRTRSKAFQDR